MTNSANQNNAFATSHSSAFVDLNGDCAADLFIESTNGGYKYWEIWLRNPSDQLFCQVAYDQITLSTSPVTFADYDANGRIDFLYADSPLSNNEALNIHVVLNTLSGDVNNLCSGASPMSNTFGSPWNNPSSGVFEFFIANL